MNTAAAVEAYFLTQDNDCHWYVVPVARKAEWNAWREIPSDDERAWEAPDFADRIGGSPGMVHFTGYSK